MDPSSYFSRRYLLKVLLSLCSKSLSSVGGYEYDFVAVPISDRYLCSICMKVLRDARLTECCGQHYCNSCLTSWLNSLRGKETCPHCRKANFQHILNREKVRDIKQLQIRCIHSKEGCTWVGELETLKRHLESDSGCGHVEVTCPYYPDKKKKKKASRYSPFPEFKKAFCQNVKRKDLPGHKQECIYRPYKCEHCGKWDTYAAIAFGRNCHYETCPEYPLTCPNVCGATDVKRKAVPDHCKTCPLEPVDCPFKQAGCSVKTPRTDIQSHMAKETQKHMLLLLTQNQELSCNNRKLTRKVDDLTKSNRGLGRRVDELECSDERLQKQVQLLQKGTDVLENRVDKLWDFTDDLNDNFDDLESRVDKLQEYTDDLNDHSDDLQYKVDSLECRTGRLERSKTRRN